MTCRHHWICQQPAFEGNTRVTQAKCKYCAATYTFRTEEKRYHEDFAVGTRPLSERLGVW